MRRDEIERLALTMACPTLYQQGRQCTHRHNGDPCYKIEKASATTLNGRTGQVSTAAHQYLPLSSFSVRRTVNCPLPSPSSSSPEICRTLPNPLPDRSVVQQRPACFGSSKMAVCLRSLSRDTADTVRPCIASGGEPRRRP